MKKTILTLALAAGITSFAGNARALTTTSTFGFGGNTFSLDFQTIGNAGNAADTTGYGSVGYNYSIGTYDISVNQLNAATANGVAGLGNGSFTGDQPAANVSWYQAAAFVNFLNTSTGHQDAYNLTYSGGAYTMALWDSGQAGYDPSNPFRNSLALFVLPSENEWYKSAYYDPSANGGTGSYNLYPTGNSIPTAVASGSAANTAVYNGVASQPSSVTQAGGLSPYGTMGQGGNVWQWQESAYAGANTDPAGYLTIRGGHWEDVAGYLQSSGRINFNPSATDSHLGFRVAELAAVPEPSTYALLGLGVLGMVIALRKNKTA
ncbi:MAG: SUMF1/EgtB/PvdO family nonheme iron enzyme [Verrucomicrobia bacterium]|nr:MAG: SUMF1/EgtB/PvdO family nonheme iron enzyme [Verrucomicrobiota bacterium]